LSAAGNSDTVIVMMTSHRVSRVFLLGVGLAASSAFAAGGPEEPLMQADRDFHKATSERRLEGWMDYMADEVVMLGGPKGPVVGKEAVRADRAGLFTENPKLDLHWEPIQGEMFPGDRLGYTTGSWTLTGTNAKGESVSLKGRYLTVWKKTADGAWKVVWDGGSAEPPKGVAKKE
jgi:ketosteroid isomerase-like protein